jgi:hypothetical protein
MAAQFDGTRQPSEEDLCAVLCHDLSASGIGFFSQKPVSGYVIIHLDDPLRLPVAVTAKVVYCREGSGDDEYPFIVGCKFVEHPAEPSLEREPDSAL